MKRTGRPAPRRGLLGRARFALVAAAIWAGAGGAAHAADADVLASAFEGGDLTGIERIDEGEMGDLRGGFRQTIAFGIFFYTNIVSPDGGANAQLPDNIGINYTDGGAQVTMGVGDFGPLQGIIQMTNINGDANIVNNTVVINVLTIDSATRGDLTTLLPIIFPNGG